MIIRSLIAAIFVAVAAPTAAHGPEETVTPNFAHAIPNIPGKSLVAAVVDYPPGAASSPHTHAKSAFIYAYVVSGAIESQVDDGPRQVYRAGESFYEPPGPATSSAGMRVRPSPRSCWRCSSSIPATRP